MAVFSRVKNWVSNEVLTASDLNAEFNNILSNMQPSGIEDLSSNVAAMQAVTSPGGVGSESLATDLAGELQRLRFKIKEITNGAQWYSTPTSHLGTGGIVTASLANGSVTQVKRAALGQQVSASCGGFEVTDTEADVTNLSVTLTTTGRPVFVAINNFYNAEIPGASGRIELNKGSAAQVGIDLVFYVDGAEFARYKSYCTTSATDLSMYIPGSVFSIDGSSAAGSHTYKIRAVREFAAGTDSVFLRNLSLIAFEL